MYMLDFKILGSHERLWDPLSFLAKKCEKCFKKLNDDEIEKNKKGPISNYFYIFWETQFFYVNKKQKAFSRGEPLPIFLMFGLLVFWRFFSPKLWIKLADSYVKLTDTIGVALHWAGN